MTIQAKSIMTIDTETVGLEGHVYDIAWAISNKRGEIVAERNWLVRENFTNPKKMMGAFYAGKTFTHYAPCLLYTSPSPRDQRGSRMPSSA